MGVLICFVKIVDQSCMNLAAIETGHDVAQNANLTEDVDTMSDKLDIYAIESALEAATHATAKASEPTVAVIWDHDWIANVVTEEIAHVFCHAPQWIHQLIAEVKAKDKRIAELEAELAEAKKDSERLNFVSETQPKITHRFGEWYIDCGDSDECYVQYNLRQAIDYARGE